MAYCDPPKEHQFKKGQSGNPNGRPKGSGGIRSLIRVIVEEPASTRRTKADWVARKLVHRAMKGNLGAIGMLIDNVDGKLSQPIEPLEVNFTFTTKKEDGTQ